MFERLVYIPLVLKDLVTDLYAIAPYFLLLFHMICSLSSVIFPERKSAL